jgi:uncharacterized protein (DUF1810 family)
VRAQPKTRLGAKIKVTGAGRGSHGAQRHPVRESLSVERAAASTDHVDRRAAWWTHIMDIDLARFVDAHEREFARALAEIERGRKQSHWMWYVFPQVAALGRSSTAQHYAVRTVDEARAFLAHPTLGRNYRRIVAAVHTQVVDSGITIERLFGAPDDAKLVSSLTLFRSVADATGDELRTQIDEILGAAVEQGYGPCSVTAAFVDSSS